MSIVISGTGIYTPMHAVTNEALVAVFNAYVEKYNHEHQDQISREEMIPLRTSDPEFILKASGIKQRYFIEKSGILDPAIMCPLIPERPAEHLSLQAEISIEAALQALQQANKTAQEIDAVIVACSNLQRPYPAMAIEIQKALEIQGFALDLNVACSSATFALQVAHDFIKAGSARAVLIVNPEICSAHLNFRDRDSHFIFGDAAAATIVETGATVNTPEVFEIKAIQLVTSFSNNVRNNAGFLNRTSPETRDNPDKLFVQEGRKVFKEIPFIVSDLILHTLESQQLSAQQIRRFWLHQANLNMNQLIMKKLGADPEDYDKAPIILDKYGNTSSAGVIIALNHYQADLADKDLGILCSFGAGYSAGCVLLQKKILG